MSCSLIKKISFVLVEYSFFSGKKKRRGEDGCSGSPLVCMNHFINWLSKYTTDGEFRGSQDAFQAINVTKWLMTSLWDEDHLLWVVMQQQYAAEIQRVKAKALRKYKPAEKNPIANCVVIERNLFKDQLIPLLLIFFVPRPDNSGAAISGNKGPALCRCKSELLLWSQLGTTYWCPMRIPSKGLNYWAISKSSVPMKQTFYPAVLQGPWERQSGFTQLEFGQHIAFH